MSKEVHNGPTDETQARGTAYSGDPQGGDGTEPAPPQKLPLDSWHRAKGGRMVPFAGYEMPVQYEGIMAEHLWTRENAGLFDVSHMGQLWFMAAMPIRRWKSFCRVNCVRLAIRNCAIRCCWPQMAASSTI